jgi:DHA1 family bicyclomycin/chloramphenicol resistance-like MFS transporter
VTDRTLQPAPALTGAPIGFAEFVALIAALMALGALGTDAMLPALPALGEALGVADENERQFVITAYTLGFGVAQLVHGPLADRFGRRRLLIGSLILFAIGNVAAAAAASFTLLLAARALSGAAIAATRVACVALVRDCYHGAAMARVMSIAFMVFMIVPILAPSVGQLVLLLGDWRAIFGGIAGVTLLALGWLVTRLPETLHPDNRRAIHPRDLAQGWAMVFRDRRSLGYMLASTALMGALYGYINSIQQVMFDTFHRPAMLAAVFAGTAGTMAIANLGNAKAVMRLGSRRISHGALLVLIAVSAVHLLFVLAGAESLVAFAVMQAVTMACFGLASSNFSAMAMENMGAIAGTASSVQGFTSITAGTLIGAAIGQSFDGTTGPMTAGFLFGGIVALACVLVTERGQLFGAA